MTKAMRIAGESVMKKSNFLHICRKVAFLKEMIY